MSPALVMTPEPSAATIPLPFSGIRAFCPPHYPLTQSLGSTVQQRQRLPPLVWFDLPLPTQAAPGQADSKPIESQGLCLTEADSDILEGVGKLMKLLRWFARLDLTGPFI